MLCLYFGCLHSHQGFGSRALAALICSPFASPGTKGLECSPSTPTMNSYFYKFMINLLKRFSSERKLLESRGAFIIRSEHPTSLKPLSSPGTGGTGMAGSSSPSTTFAQSQNHFLKLPSLSNKRFWSKQDLPFTCQGTIFLSPITGGKVAPY